MVLAACAPRSTPAPTATDIARVIVPAGFTASQVASGLNAPTAMALGPSRDPLTGNGQRLYVAQLNGGENDGAGQVVAIDLASKSREVVIEELQKPTGLAWWDDALYVVAYRDVLKYTARDGALSGPQPLVTGVRFNGRSLGHIRVGPTPDPFTGEGDPRLYFHSSGGDPNVSGYLYSMRLDGSDQRIVARGLKNAYAFTWSPASGTMYATEIGDNIASEPVEEVNVIRQDGDYGWPACRAGRACGNTPAPLTTFPAHSTPTGIAWWEDSLIVTLWGPTDPHVARIALDGAERATGVSAFARGLRNPIDLAVTWIGSLLMLDFAGEIWEVRADPPADARDLPPPRPSPTP